MEGNEKEEAEEIAEAVVLDGIGDEEIELEARLSFRERGAA